MDMGVDETGKEIVFRFLRERGDGMDVRSTDLQSDGADLPTIEIDEIGLYLHPHLLFVSLLLSLYWNLRGSIQSEGRKSKGVADIIVVVL
jgi:hypothetical protein